MSKHLKNLMDEADRRGSAEVRYTGLFIQTQANLISEQDGWPENDKSKRTDFSQYGYWLTTDNGADPIGFDSADDEEIEDLVKE